MSDSFTLLDRLQKEWPVIAGAPFSFAIAVLIVGIVVHVLTRWHYKALLTLKDEQLKTKEERLDGKEQVISEYRERLHLLPLTSGPYLQLTNAQLQQKVFSVVQKLRQFLTTVNASRSLPSLMETDATDEEWREAQERYIQESAASHSWIESEYDAQFRTDMILLRDELRSRTTDPSNSEETRYINSRYERPVNAIAMRDVASHLERLAKQLGSPSP